jgi:hypothetical protein
MCDAGLQVTKQNARLTIAFPFQEVVSWVPGWTAAGQIERAPCYFSEDGISIND